MRTPRFSDQLYITFSNTASALLRKKYWVVTKAFSYNITEAGDEVIYIPQGYLTDGASIPKILQGVITPWGKYSQACVVHDYLCEYLQIWKDGVIVKIDRKRCDKILDEALRESEVSSWTMRSIYKSVVFYRYFAAVINPSFSLEKRNLERRIVDSYNSTKRWI